VDTILGRWPDAQYTAYFPPGTTVKATDRIVVTAYPARESYLSGKTFSVKEVTRLSGTVIEAIVGKVDPS
jgi:hypothetical protein